MTSGFTVHGVNWNAFVAAVPAVFLHRVYRKFKTKLFSANVRDYLGSRKSDQNINHGIKQTAENNPANFLVLNNGLTILVNDYEYLSSAWKKSLRVNGLSIVNGAQTTGAIGSLRKTPLASALLTTQKKHAFFVAMDYWQCTVFISGSVEAMLPAPG